MNRITVALLLGLLAAASAVAWAQEEASLPLPTEATPALCDCGSADCAACCGDAPGGRHARSGYGLCVAPWARLTYDRKYMSYYVGGSMNPNRLATRARPEPRYPWEGVWGTDYVPALTRVELWWTHGRLYQDGPGQYEPDHRNRPFSLRFGKDR